MFNERKRKLNGLEIAVIGISGRFPGAKNILEFWENLKNGVESVSFFSEEELKEAGLKVEDMVKSRFVLEDREFFDASFFDFTSTQAKLMDPQMRIFLECVWEALEDAGHNPDTYNGLIGLFAGVGSSFGWEAKLLLSEMTNILRGFESGQLLNRDFICSMTAGKMNLKGPCVLVNTACSTSLVSIHLACQALLNGECNIAISGGVSVIDWQGYGHFYQEGMIRSPDGHCRTFDAESKGTIGGEGAGIVVLKRYSDAVSEGDHIYAVIKGSAINNEGKRKVGSSAPGVKGLVEVIKKTFQIAEVSPESISYVETHGTGTLIGDSIEIEGLKQAFNTKKRGYCGIGSVKTNIGNLNAAAGIAGFVKTVLALKHQLIPPGLHFQKSNPKINLEKSPFYLNTQLKEWKRNKTPLQAGVSSLGIDGTNAHVILEEMPAQYRGEVSSPSRDYQIILLSAKTKSALDKMKEKLAEYLKKNRNINIADVAYTLMMGRRIFQYKSMFVCSDIDDVVDILSSKDSHKIFTFESKIEKASVIFLFAGLGSQYENMGKALYQTERVFREEMDRCFGILKSLGYDVASTLYPPESPSNLSFLTSHQSMYQFEISQLVIFVLEYSLAKLILSWGIKPHAMIGYSFGEYVAACLSGVFSLREVLKLIVIRGKLIQKVGKGKMLDVPVSKEELKNFLNDELSIAIDNGSSCIVSGSTEAIEHFEKEMKDRRYLCIPLNCSHAVHSKMMEGVIEDFKKELNQIEMNKPKIPFISNVTGNWITAEEAIDPGYWVKHLRETVLFSRGIKELLMMENPVFIEIGPGNDLTLMIKSFVNKEFTFQVLNLLKNEHRKIPEIKFLLNKLGQLYLNGVDIDWSKFYHEEKRYRVTLPAYPFERQYYWIDDSVFKRRRDLFLNHLTSDQSEDTGNSCCIPTWKQIPLSTENKKLNGFSFLIFIDDTGFGSGLARRLEQVNKNVIIVKRGVDFNRVEDFLFTINPGNRENYNELFNHLSSIGEIPQLIFHAWNISKENVGEVNFDDLNKSYEPGFKSLEYLADAIGALKEEKEFKIIVLSNNIQESIGEDINYLKSVLLGPVNSISNEKYYNISFKSVDVIIPGCDTGDENILYNHILNEMLGNISDPVVSYRNNKRWVKCYEPINFEESLTESEDFFKPQGVYLVTGRLIGIGFALTKYLVKDVGAKIILAWNQTYPLRWDWKTWLDNHDQDNDISLQIKNLKELEKISSDILILRTETDSLNQMEEMVKQGVEWFGQLNGVIHNFFTADKGIIDDSGRKYLDKSDKYIKKRVRELVILDQVLKNQALDCCIVLSSGSFVSRDIIDHTIYNFTERMITWQNQRSSFPWIGIHIDYLKKNNNRIQPLIGEDQYLKKIVKLLSSGKRGQMVINYKIKY